MGISVRGVEERDEAAWAGLYAGYRAFYRLPEDAAALEASWRWVTAGAHGLLGLVAVDDRDIPVGLANLRWFARPLAGSLGLYLDDLFTSPASRGLGVGSALLDRAAALAAEHGASVVRWITAADNEVARRLYDEHAEGTAWVTYDMAPRPGGPI